MTTKIIAKSIQRAVNRITKKDTWETENEDNAMVCSGAKEREAEDDDVNSGSIAPSGASKRNEEDNQAVDPLGASKRKAGDSNVVASTGAHHQNNPRINAETIKRNLAEKKKRIPSGRKEKTHSFQSV